MRKIFSIGMLVVLSYYLLWYVFRAAGLDWPTALNIPGFALLLGSMPWSWPATSNILMLTNLLGQYGRDAVIIFSVSIGFSLNLSVLVFFISKLSQAVRRKGHHV